MTMDTSGKWWTGSEAEDIKEYLEAYSEEGYPIDEFRLAVCDCGSKIFFLEADIDEGVAKRICVKCGKEHFICDSEEFLSDAKLKKKKCGICKHTEMNIGIGFVLYKEEDGVKWLYIGARCSKCNVLGCYGDWKVGYGPSKDVIEKE